MKLHPLSKREKQKQDDNLKIEKNETQQKHALNMYCKEIYTVYIGKLISEKMSRSDKIDNLVLNTNL
jgi:hypothetical protein